MTNVSNTQQEFTGHQRQGAPRGERASTQLRVPLLAKRTGTKEASDIPVHIKRGRAGTVLRVPARHKLLHTGKKTTILRFGNRRMQARVLEAPSEDEHATLVLGRRVAWPHHAPSWLWLQTSQTGSCRVGPIIGILSATYRRTRYGPQNYLFRRMIQEANELGAFVYIFSPGGVRRQTGSVRGYRHDGHMWRPGIYPMPNVVYNRTRTTPATAATERYMRYRRRIPVFNSRIGSKWRQHIILWRDQSLREHLPRTRLLRSQRDLRAIVRRHGGAYVKPTRGGFGRGIWRVERHARSYRVFRTDRRGRSRYVGNMSLARAYRLIRRSRMSFVAQQRLRLIRWEGRVADVRVLVQKNIQNEWVVTGAGVRIGSGRTIVSNLSGGGEAKSLQEVLEHVFPDQANLRSHIQQQVPRIAQHIARRIELFARPLGELGIDLAIDTEGRIWFLEANSRTGRNVFRRIDKNESGRDADRRPIEYSFHLARFRPSPSVSSTHTVI